MTNKKILRISLATLLLVLCNVTPARAFPPLPSSFYGVVQQEGENIPDGTLVEALINGQVMAYTLSGTYEGQSMYSLDIPGDDTTTHAIEGGIPGQIIQFRVGGKLADQTASWTSGVNQNLDLTLDASKEPSSTLATLPDDPTQTPLSQATPLPTTTMTRMPTIDDGSSEKDPTTPPTQTTSAPTNTPTQTIHHTQWVSPTLTIAGEVISLKSTSNAKTPNAAADDQNSAGAYLSISFDEQDQAPTPKGNRVLWIGLPLLLLGCTLALVWALRHIKKLRRKSPRI